TKPNQTKPNQTKPNQTKPNRANTEPTGNQAKKEGPNLRLAPVQGGNVRRSEPSSLDDAMHNIKQNRETASVIFAVAAIQLCQKSIVV
ncbi:MAG: hypothetical protein QM537_02115, partial [Candidatus Symbiobacter sp.]|nr:hypothetical protein [Candidatus Symbiobacter sp.]